MRQVHLKYGFLTADNFIMVRSIKENSALSVMESYVAELRFYLLDFSMRGEKIPNTLMNELFLAERLARILLKEPE